MEFTPPARVFLSLLCALCPMSDLRVMKIRYHIFCAGNWQLPLRDDQQHTHSTLEPLVHLSEDILALALLHLPLFLPARTRN
jgi:hypothetical protein